MGKHLVSIIVFLIVIQTPAQSKKELLDFQFEDFKLSGVLNLPEQTETKGIVLIVHGDGPTNAIAQEWYYDVRHAIIAAGYGTYMWDKMGCGNSEGVYKQNQTVQNSAEEVIAAINGLKTSKVTGATNIGLWGISRAGWINPIVINRYPDIAFWISVSGVDDDETFKYLLAQNLRINGQQENKITQIVNEWHQGILMSREGADYDSYLKATPNLRENPFWNRITNGGINESSYYSYQKVLVESKLDKISRLPLYVDDFEELLANINIPILALFGKKDMHVNWQQTKALYERVFVKNKDFSVASFPNSNHNLHICKTGGFYEFEDDGLTYERSQAFLESITAWLDKR